MLQIYLFLNRSLDQNITISLADRNVGTGFETVVGN